MNKKEFFISSIIVILIGSILIIITNNSFAFEYKNINYSLFDKEDDELISDIKIYLGNIDDYLIPNSSFIYSEILSENYDFLTNFALDYIINNRELYVDKIKNLGNYSYYNNSHKLMNTNEYIDMDEVYSITDKFFGISNYNIINDNVNIIDNYVSLSDYTTGIFTANIVDISIVHDSGYVIATVGYDSGEKYKYTFKVRYNVLKIYNIEVVE